MTTSTTESRQGVTVEAPEREKAPANIVDVAEYLLGHFENGISTMKLQKLLYLSQGWHLAITGSPLFAEEFEAWPSGPVNRVIYELTKGEFTIHAGFIYEKLRSLTPMPHSLS